MRGRNGGVESVKELKIEREMMRINERKNHGSLIICSLFLTGGSAPCCSLPSFWFGSVERVKKWRKEVLERVERIMEERRHRQEAG